MQTLKCKLTGVEVEYNKKMQQSTLPKKSLATFKLNKRCIDKSYKLDMMLLGGL